MIRIPHIIAHRGASIEAPENTLAAIRVTSARGARWIECDVTLTSDGACVLFHDDTLERTSTGHGVIGHHDLASLRALDAGSWFSDIYIGERIPTLEDAFDTLAALEMGVNLEIKPSGCDPVALCKEVAKRIGQRRDVPVLLSSFDDGAVAVIPDLLPGIPCGWLVEEIPVNWQERYQALNARALHCDHKSLTRAQAEEVVAAGVPLVCYTINDPVRAAELFDWGVTSVITDDPARMIAAIPRPPA
ncbi:glycerophosphodiester phosphodiesterase family protein [Thalassospira sp.]|uniref:glycerophosphodiester phosphodiesterase family protein n=1 Tax=Thalassospira sp. TaxID=1912094 RepID=UPI0027360BC8|nr:glycerophosphodiester phosphodiesterase family protein [Thalassospira sp.]MDP2700206.1 glycerophosphodiester phosphodiesterase family protein [Thalassospira sp.]